MNNIFERDLKGEMVSPSDTGYDELINSIWKTMKTAAEHQNRQRLFYTTVLHIFRAWWHHTR